MTPAHQISGALIGASSGSPASGTRATTSPDAAQRRQRIVVVEQLDGLAVEAADARAAVGVDADEAPQYVARPPEMSKHAPVEKLISSLASQQTSAATSGGSPTRESGMRAVM